MTQVLLEWIDPITGEVCRMAFAVPLTIGSGPENGLVLSDVRISRNHAAIESEEGQIIIRDLESRSGVEVNGQPVTRAVLTNGAIIGIGSHALLVTLESAPPPSIRAEAPPLPTLIDTSIHQGPTTSIHGAEGCRR